MTGVLDLHKEGLERIFKARIDDILRNPNPAAQEFAQQAIKVNTFYGVHDALVWLDYQLAYPHLFRL